MGCMQRVYAAAKRKQATIVLAEAEDERVIKAAAAIEKQELVKLILLGDPKKVAALQKRLKVKLKAQTMCFATYPDAERLAKRMVALRRRKGLVLDEARHLLETSTTYFAAMLVAEGAADGYVSGNLCPTAETVRPALQLLGTESGYASSHFLMLRTRAGKEEALLYADCALNPDPRAEELSLIAAQTAKSAQLYGLKPKVAFLSFSTKGSALHDRVTKVQLAVKLAKQHLSIPVDGELQFDAAYVADVAKRKASGSKVAGKANTFIFPSLEAGNIAYKITERLAGFQAVGPVLQGLKRPANDLSRGCSVQDIVDVVAITAAQSG